MTAHHGPDTPATLSALRESEERLNVIFDHIQDVVFLLDVDPGGYRFAAVNPAFVQATGLAPETVVGKRVEEVIPQPSLDMVLARYAEAALSGMPVYWEEVTEYPAGTKYGEVMVAPIMDAGGRCIQLVGTVHDVTERREAADALHRLAHFDGLTGLPNRRHFIASLDQRIKQAARTGNDIALMHLDLDRFKQVNDAHGHSAGDAVLRRVAELLLEHASHRDLVGRFGGDEFGVIVPDGTDPERLATRVGALLGDIGQPFRVGDEEVSVTCSIGVATCAPGSCDAEHLIGFADTAMYHAKQSGRNGYRFYQESMGHRARERKQLERELRDALANDEFMLNYQPIVAIGQGRCVGVEVLLRWQSPTRGLVTPGEMIPLLEESGLILPVGMWVIDAACRQLAEWRAAGIPDLYVSVNVSARQVMAEYNRQRTVAGRRKAVESARDGVSLVGHVARCLQGYGIEPWAVQLELTESTLMSEVQQATSLLVRLKELGVRIAVDDFGTGYSSLAYLKRFPIDTLKLDAAFVHDLPDDAESLAITRAVIDLARSLQLGIVAEGVETERQARHLLAEGCEHAQGFLFSQPMTAAELLPRLLAEAGHHGD